ncbi:MAG: ankyrin repeat domain-containing protein [Pseudomonadota bacterium]
MLEAGANINTTDALREFIRNDNIEAVKILISAGANVDTDDYTHLTPLHHEASNGNNNIVSELINASANIAAVDDMQATPIFYAQMQHHYNVIDTLKQAGAELNYNNTWCNTNYNDHKSIWIYEYNMDLSKYKVEAVCALQSDAAVELAWVP